MAFQAVQAARIGDARANGNLSRNIVVADASFDGGYAAKFTTGEANTWMGVCFDNANSLTGSYAQRAYCDFDCVSMTANLTINQNGILLLDGQTTLDASTADGDSHINAQICAQSTDASGNLAILQRVKTAATTYISGSSYQLTNGQIYKLELEVKWVDATHVTLTTYVNGTQQIQDTFNTGVFNNFVFRRALCGSPAQTLWAKGTSIEWHFGTLVASDSSTQTGTDCAKRVTQWGDGNGPKVELRLPSGNKAGETGWCNYPVGGPAGAAGTGVYTNWNEAVGTWTTSDNGNAIVRTGASPIVSTQGSTLSNTAISASAVIVGLSMHAVGLVGRSTTMTFDIPDGTGTNPLTPYTATNTPFFQMQSWPAPASGSWSLTELNTLWLRCKENHGENYGNDVVIATLWELTCYYGFVTDWMVPTNQPIFEKTDVVAY